MRVLKNKSSFSVIELMIVTIIVAILAVVLIPLLTGNKAGAYATEAEAALGTVRTALRIYQAEQDQYPVFAAGDVEGRVPGISVGDLLGTFFDAANYRIVSDGTNYNITCYWYAKGSNASRNNDVIGYSGYSTTLNQDGVFTSTGY